MKPSTIKLILGVIILIGLMSSLTSCSISPDPIHLRKAINPLTLRVDFVKCYNPYKKGDTIWYEIDTHIQIQNINYTGGYTELMIVQ